MLLYGLKWRALSWLLISAGAAMVGIAVVGLTMLGNRARVVGTPAFKVLYGGGHIGIARIETREAQADSLNPAVESLVIRRWRILYEWPGGSRWARTRYSFSAGEVRTIPLVWVLGLGLVSLSIGFVLLRRVRRRGGHCPACGYDLRGLQHTEGHLTCPECGAASKAS